MVTAVMKLKDGCFLEGKLGRTNLYSIIKGKELSLLKKVCIVKAMVFPVIYGSETRTIKKSEC